MRKHPHPMRRWLAGLTVAALTATVAGTLTAGPAAAESAPDWSSGTGLSRGQQADLYRVAQDTWRFYAKDVDATTHLPLDNLGPGTVRGTYTSAANIGVYLWAIVSARDLRLISTATATREARETLTTVSHLQRTDGMLHQWYDTSTGAVIPGGGQAPCAATSGTQDNCSFLSAVDNGWYASGLVVVRQALPGVARLASSLLNQMDFSIFYDDRAQTACNTNASIDNQPTGQQYGGYYAGVGPAGYHNGALYSDPRISMYMGMGLGQMPGDVWWRTWRTLPPQQCSSDPIFSWQGQWPAQGQWVQVKDPLSHKTFRVWEGHYTYPGTDLNYLPTYNGGMFEALMADLVVPETVWGPRGFGQADRLSAQVQIRYATQQLHYPVWGISPSSTPDATGGYNAYGVQGLTFPVGQQLAQGPCPSCQPSPEGAVTPHASFLAMMVAPQQAYANIATLRRLYPGIYSADGGFYDAVDPLTGSVGQRRLVLDQSMIMAALDDVLNHGALQRDFAMDPTSRAARLELGAETMTITGATARR